MRPQVLINSLGLEIVVLCMFYSAPSDGPLVINPVKIIVNGALCATICIPCMLIFAWLFNPMIFVRVGKWCLTTLFCWPRSLYRGFSRCCAATRTRTAACRCLPITCVRVAHASLLRRPSARVAPSPGGPVVGTPIATMAALEGDSATTITTITTTTTTTTIVAATPPPSPPPPPDSPPPAADPTGATPPPHLATTPQRMAVTPRNPFGLVVAGKKRRVTMAAPPAECGEPERGASERGAADAAARTSTTQHRRPSLSAALKRAVSRMGPVPGTQTRQYSYASLNEHLFAQSLTKSWERNDWRAVARILFGWSLNILLFFAMVLLFILYGCEIYHLTTAATITGQELVLSWAWSVFQRFIVNEPVLILVGKGAPMLFTTALCANVCGESIANLLGLIVAGIVTCIKEIKSGGG